MSIPSVDASKAAAAAAAAACVRPFIPSVSQSSQSDSVEVRQETRGPCFLSGQNFGRSAHPLLLAGLLLGERLVARAAPTAAGPGTPAPPAAVLHARQKDWAKKKKKFES